MIIRISNYINEGMRLQPGDKFLVSIPERLNRGNWIQYALTNYPNHKVYIIKQQEPLGVIQETIYLLPEEDMELYSAPEVKEKRTENELPIF